MKGVGRFELAINPLFWILVSISLCFGAYMTLLSCVIAFFLHETGHLASARILNVDVEKVVVSMEGAMIVPRDANHLHMGVIVLSGPIVNLLAYLVIILLIHIFDIQSVFIGVLGRANAVIGLFNLLPAYPLDGARLILSFSRDRIRTLEILKYVGLGISIALLLAFILSIFYRPNITLAVSSVFLGFSAIKGTDMEMYCYLSERLNLDKFSRV